MLNLVKSVPWYRTSVASTLALLILVGCGGKEDNEVGQSPSPAKLDSGAARDPLTTIRTHVASGDLEQAARRVRGHLVTHPEDIEAVMLAAEIEVARTQYSAAADLYASVPLDHPHHGTTAALACVRQLVAGDRLWDARTHADAAIDKLPNMTDLRYARFDALMHLGMIRSAAADVDFIATRDMLNREKLELLVGRSRVLTMNHPELVDAETGETLPLVAALTLAVAQANQRDYEKAITALNKEREGQFSSFESAGLFGRLLVRAERFEEMAEWHARCPKDIGKSSDYWVALGGLFKRNQIHLAAVGALLRAIALDNNDEQSYRWLSESLAALGHDDAAAQALYRSENLEKFNNAFSRYLRNQDHAGFQKEVAQRLRLLNRPIEAWHWDAAFAGKPAQRDDLLQLVAKVSQRREDPLLGLSLADFPYEDKLASTLGAIAASSQTVRPKHPGVTAEPVLKDVAAQVGLDFWYHNRSELNFDYVQLHESLGGGIGILDFDRDGWPDLYLAQGSADPPDFIGTKSNVLLRNLDGRFIEATNKAGTANHDYSLGVAVGDINQDGFPDIYVGNLGTNQLLINNGDGTFSDASDRLHDRSGNIDRSAFFSSSVAIADIDGDGVVDLFEGNYIDCSDTYDVPKTSGGVGLPEPSPLSHPAQPDRIFRGTRDGRFIEFVVDSSITKAGSTLGVVVSQFDRSGRNKVFIGNDVRPNHYLGFAGGKFVNLSAVKGNANGSDGSPKGCMGIATGDFDRDGRLDLQIANFENESANLYLQNLDGGFRDVAARYGLDQLTRPMVGFGTKAHDFDRNGWLDFIITNGHIFDHNDHQRPFRMPPQVLMSRADQRAGHAGDFGGYESVALQGNPYFDGTYLGRTIAKIDFDRDGSIDFVVNHLDRKVALLKNETSTTGNWVQLELVGTESPVDVTGAQVTVVCNGEEFHEWVTAGDGYLCSDQPLIDVGLGEYDEIDRVDVAWPNGKVQSFDAIKVGTRVLLVEGDDEAFERTLSP